MPSLGLKRFLYLLLRCYKRIFPGKDEHSVIFPQNMLADKNILISAHWAITPPWHITQEMRNLCYPLSHKIQETFIYTKRAVYYVWVNFDAGEKEKKEAISKKLMEIMDV